MTSCSTSPLRFPKKGFKIIGSRGNAERKGESILLLFSGSFQQILPHQANQSQGILVTMWSVAVILHKTLNFTEPVWIVSNSMAVQGIIQHSILKCKWKLKYQLDIYFFIKLFTKSTNIKKLVWFVFNSGSSTPYPPVKHCFYSKV